MSLRKYSGVPCGTESVPLTTTKTILPTLLLTIPQTKHNFITLVKTCWACQPTPSHRTRGGGIGSLPLATTETILFTCATDILLLYYTHHKQSSFITPVETCWACQPVSGRRTWGGGIGSVPRASHYKNCSFYLHYRYLAATHTPLFYYPCRDLLSMTACPWPYDLRWWWDWAGSTSHYKSYPYNLVAVPHTHHKAQFHYPCRDLLSMATRPWL